ncbi:MAG: methyltransferase domain-containing protein [Pseudomonadota bacterium]
MRALRDIAQQRDYETAMVFGGSIGMEAVELAGILPGIKVSSYEIKPDLVRASRQFCQLENTEFLVSNWKSIEKRAPYDVILANSVLCDHPNANAKDTLTNFPFKRFAHVVGRLIEVMAPGGCLMICNANYSLLDIGAEELGLYPVTGLQPFQGFTSLFDQHSRKLITCSVGHGQFPRYASPSMDRDAVWRRLTSSVFVGSEPAHVPLIDLDTHDRLASYDPYMSQNTANSDAEGMDIPYTVEVRQRVDEPGFWLQYLDPSDQPFFQIPCGFDPNPNSLLHGQGAPKKKPQYDRAIQ